VRSLRDKPGETWRSCRELWGDGGSFETRYIPGRRDENRAPSCTKGEGNCCFLCTGRCWWEIRAPRKRLRKQCGCPGQCLAGSRLQTITMTRLANPWTEIAWYVPLCYLWVLEKGLVSIPRRTWTPYSFPASADCVTCRRLCTGHLANRWKACSLLERPLPSSLPYSKSAAQRFIPSREPPRTDYSPVS
jgi:hypothetical protein